MGAELPVWFDVLLTFFALSHEASKLLDALDQGQVFGPSILVISWHLAASEVFSTYLTRWTETTDAPGSRA